MGLGLGPRAFGISKLQARTQTGKQKIADIQASI